MAKQNNKTKKRTFKDMVDNRDYKDGLRLITIIVLIAAICAAFNILASHIPSKDIAVKNASKLSPSTIELLDRLDRDITVYLMTEEGKEDENTVAMLNMYAKKSKHFVWEEKSISRDYAFLKEYTGNEKAADNSLVVSTDTRSQLVMYDIYKIDTSFQLETYLNSAIVYLTGDAQYKAYELDSDSSVKLGETTVSNMALDGFEVEELDLTQGKRVPDDCDVLIVPGLEADLSDAEADAMIEYAENGGKLFLATNYVDGSVKNINRVTKIFGAGAAAGFIAEQDSNKFILDNAVNIMPYIYPDEKDLITQGVTQIGMHLAHPIDVIKTEGVETQTILTSSETSMLYKYNNLTGAPEYEQGPFTVGAFFEKGDSEMMWISTSFITNESVSAYVGGSNLAIFMNSVCYMVSDGARSSIYSTTKAAKYTSITNEVIYMWRNILMIVIPGVVLLIGAAVVIIRRRRR